MRRGVYKVSRVFVAKNECAMFSQNLRFSEYIAHSSSATKTRDTLYTPRRAPPPHARSFFRKVHVTPQGVTFIYFPKESPRNSLASFCKNQNAKHFLRMIRTEATFFSSACSSTSDSIGGMLLRFTSGNEGSLAGVSIGICSHFDPARLPFFLPLGLNAGALPRSWTFDNFQCFTVHLLTHLQLHHYIINN